MWFLLPLWHLSWVHLLKHVSWHSNVSSCVWAWLALLLESLINTQWPFFFFFLGESNDTWRKENQWHKNLGFLYIYILCDKRKLDFKHSSFFCGAFLVSVSSIFTATSLKIWCFLSIGACWSGEKHVLWDINEIMGGKWAQTQTSTHWNLYYCFLISCLLLAFIYFIYFCLLFLLFLFFCLLKNWRWTL